MQRFRPTPHLHAKMGKKQPELAQCLSKSNSRKYTTIIDVGILAPCWNFGLHTPLRQTFSLAAWLALLPYAYPFWSRPRVGRRKVKEPNSMDPRAICSTSSMSAEWNQY